jgi:hypothetical protein
VAFLVTTAIQTAQPLQETKNSRVKKYTYLSEDEAYGRLIFERTAYGVSVAYWLRGRMVLSCGDHGIVSSCSITCFFNNLLTVRFS